MLERQIDWQMDLLGVYDKLQDVPFEWGKMDCVIFAATCVDAMTGSTIVPGLLGKYDSEVSCKRYIVETYGSLEGSISAFLPPVELTHAGRGDVVTFEGAEGITTGILWSTGVFAMGPNGVVLFPQSIVKLTKAWRV